MRSFILIVILTVILSNAQQNDDKNNKSFSHSIRNFQLNLLYHTGNHFEQHLVLAPFSVWALMAVLAEGTMGETNRELRTYIGKIVSKEFSHEGFANVTQFLQQKSSVTVERTSALFHDLNVAIKPDYAMDVSKYYDTKVVKIDASQPQVAAMKVNEYFRKNTHGRIGEIASPDTFIDTRIMLAETLYFKGRWTKPFNVSVTTEENFYNDAGEKIGTVNMMYQRTPLGFSNLEKLGGHVIELPYGDRDQFAMLVMLPYHGVRLVEMFVSLKTVSFPEIFQRLAQDKLNYGTDDVDVWLPRFKISIEANLVEPLTLMGIHSIFETDANFSRMTDDAMYVTGVIHKAEIEVTEEGTVASAATGAMLSHRTAVPKFRADRPFVFVILEKASETILFSGIYSKPSLF